MPYPANPVSPPRLLAQAQMLARAGDFDTAERLCRELLIATPDSIETLRLLAKLALARHRAGEAVEWLECAARHRRNHRDVLKELGAAYRAAGALDSARYVFARVLELDPHDATARLLLGDVFELDARPEPALAHYFLALREAAAQRLWLSEADVPMPLRALVTHAREVVDRHRAELAARALATAREHFDAAAARRMDAAVAHYLAISPLTTIELPELPAGFIDTVDFPTLASATTTIRAELDTFLADPPPSPQFAPFSFLPTPPEVPDLPVRRIVLTQRSGRSHCVAERFLRSWAALTASGLPDTPGVSPETLLVVLAPGARLALPPRSNALAGIVLALDDGLVVEVGDSQRVTSTGQIEAFGLALGASLLNGGQIITAALSTEMWHPALNASEREALANLLAADAHFLANVEALA